MKNYLKVDLKRTDSQVALIKQLGSRKKEESLAAAEAIAQIVSQPLLQVIEQAPVISNIFQTLTYSAGTPPSIPLDTFFDVKQRDFLNVWTQSQPGGTATNFVQGLTEMFVATYELWSAAYLNKNYARSASLPVIARTLERLAQEILIKQNINSANILLSSLASAVIDGNPANTAAANYQVIRAAAQGVFQLADFNALMVKYRRIVSSWVGGTPVGVRASLTDLFGSPEWMGQIRAIAYQPQNTRQVVATQGASALGAPDSIRENIFQAAGIPELFGVALHEYNEFGINSLGSFNSIFGTYAGATAYGGYGDPNTGTAAFAGATEQIVVGLNSSMFDLVKLVEEGESGTLEVAADDQFTLRSDKVGWTARQKLGFVSLDNRSKTGLIW